MTPRIRANGTTGDIAIVGAGPAGAATACHFARAGFRVVLIDQRRFPRDKVCGDFVGPAALMELDRLGVSANPVVRDANRIRHGALSVRGNTVVTRPFPHIAGLRDHGLCIPRVLLDEAIVQAAVESGACLLEEARVTGYETDTTGVMLSYQERGAQKRLRARLLIGADGSASLLSRILRGAKPPRRDRIVAIRAYYDGVEGPADQADLHVNASSTPGYSWVFPTGPSSANVGLAVPLEAYAPDSLQLGDLLVRLIESDPTIRCRLARAKVNGKLVGWPLTTYNPRLPIIANRVALIGDAAGLINPLSGEGIQYALRSASWIVEALLHPLASDDLSAAGLRPYATRVQAEMRYDMALSRFIVDLSKNRSLNPLWLSALEAAGRRAASDSEYFVTAAGLFAGIVSARELLTLAFGWSTVKAAARTGYAAARDALRGTSRVWTGRATRTKAVISMLNESVAHPVATIEWGIDCARDALELATQMAISAAAARQRGAEHHPANEERAR